MEVCVLLRKYLLSIRVSRMIVCSWNDEGCRHMHNYAKIA